MAWSVAALVAVAVHHQVSAAQAQRAAWGRTTEVVVAGTDVAAGEPLAGRVRTVALPAAVVPDGAVDVIPSSRRAARSLGRGEILTVADVAGVERGPVASRLPDGTVGVRVTPGPGTPEVEPGDLVDVIAATDPYGAVAAAPVARGARVISSTPDAVTLAVVADDATPTAGAALAGPVALVVRP